jgi:hypothetical protein
MDKCPICGLKSGCHCAETEPPMPTLEEPETMLGRMFKADTVTTINELQQGRKDAVRRVDKQWYCHYFHNQKYIDKLPTGFRQTFNEDFGKIKHN